MTQDHPLFLLGKLQAKLERLDDLLQEVKSREPEQTALTLTLTLPEIEDLQRSIDADIERLVGIYANPLQQIQEITEEHRNAYMDVARETVNTSPEKLRRNG